MPSTKLGSINLKMLSEDDQVILKKPKYHAAEFNSISSEISERDGSDSRSQIACPKTEVKQERIEIK